MEASSEVLGREPFLDSPRARRAQARENPLSESGWKKTEISKQERGERRRLPFATHSRRGISRAKEKSPSRMFVVPPTARRRKELDRASGANVSISPILEPGQVAVVSDHQHFERLSQRLKRQLGPPGFEVVREEPERQLERRLQIDDSES